MSEDVVLQSPQIVAAELDISAATLRRWSDEFTDYLSEGTRAKKNGKSHRRYTYDDINALFKVKDLMNNGMTYEKVRQELNSKPIEVMDISSKTVDNTNGSSVMANIERLEDNEDNAEWALVAPDDPESQAISFLTNTLSTLSDSQKSILNSQAANRELLGVLLQDNFNLKEENSRLRERILEVERDVAQSKQEEEWRREALRQELETKITAASQLASESIKIANEVETPEIKAVENKPGCLGMILGRGGTQIITTAHRRKKSEAAPGQQVQHPPVSQPIAPPTALPGQPAKNYPKPMFPPE